VDKLIMLDVFSPANERRLKFLRVFCIIALTATLPFAPISIIRHDNVSGLGMIMLSCAIITVLILVRHGQNLAIAAHILCAAEFVTLAGILLLPSDSSGAIFGLPILVLLAYFLLGRSGGIAWTVPSLSVITALYLLSQAKLITSSLPFSYCISAIVCLVVLTAMMYAYEGITLAYEELLRDREQILEKELRQNQDLTLQLGAAKQDLEMKVKERTTELHAEQAKLRASIEGMALGFLFVDTSGKLIIHNHAVEKVLTGIKLDSVQTIDSALSGTDLADSVKQVENSHRDVEIENIIWREKTLHFFLAPVSLEAAHNREILGTVILIENITEAKALERSKDEFFSIASHELRTPLTVIKGNASMLRDMYSDQMKDVSMAEMVDDIHESSNRLIAIVNDFLDVSRLEQGKIVFRPSEFDIANVIDAVVYEMRPILESKHIYLKADTIKPGDFPSLWADMDRTKQVVYNLVGNAAKFTDKGGITITVKRIGSKLRVMIKDTGRGIPLDKQSLLFRKFQQAGESLLTRDTTRGTGLGLYISKIMVQSMGGDISLDSSVAGDGSSFSFTLPMATPALKKQAIEVESKIDTATGLSQASKK
jgi:signal transduction histidine kinase